MATPRCAIGLLTWNGGEDVVRCARSVLAQTEPNLEIVWIDNASGDGTVERLLREIPGFALPRVQPRNTGFCGGHNLGIATATAPYYLALNQDAILAPDYVARLCDWMDEDPRLALASGLILQGEPDGERQRIYSAGMAMGRGRFPFELYNGEPLDPALEVRRRTPAVTGAAILLRRDAVLALADTPGEVFPAPFFAYFEEVDLAMRAARAGLHCGVEGRALAWHLARGQEGSGNPVIRAHYIKNHWLLSLRQGGLGQIVRDLPYILNGELRRYLPRYLSAPGATLHAIWHTLRLMPWALRSNARMRDRLVEHSVPTRVFFEESTIALGEARSGESRKVQ